MKLIKSIIKLNSLETKLNVYENKQKTKQNLLKQYFKFIIFQLIP